MVLFVAGLMKDSRPLVQFVYEMQVEVYLNEMRSRVRLSIDADLFRGLQAESSVRLVDDPLHNKYINYCLGGDTTVYFPSQVYHFDWMRHGVVLEKHLIQGEEISPCAMFIRRPDEAVMDSLLSICSQIWKHQPVTHLWIFDVTCNSLEAPRLTKPQTVNLSFCKFPEDFIKIILSQLIECHCGETLQYLQLNYMDLSPFESLLDELLEDLVAHHEAGLAQRKLWLLLELGGDGDKPINLSSRFRKKWRNRCEKVDSIHCRINDNNNNHLFLLLFTILFVFFLFFFNYL